MAVLLRVFRIGVIVAAVGVAAAAAATLARTLHAPRPHRVAPAPTHTVAHTAPSVAPVGLSSLAYVLVKVEVRARASAFDGTFAEVLVKPAAARRPDCPPTALVDGRSATWLRTGADGAALHRVVDVCIPVQGQYRLSRPHHMAGQLQRDSLVRESPLAEEAPYVRTASLVVRSEAGQFELGAAAGGVVACESVECAAPVYSAAALVGIARGRFGPGVLRVRVPEGETAVGIEPLDDGL